jgi:hypothetical protein
MNLTLRGSESAEPCSDFSWLTSSYFFPQSSELLSPHIRSCLSGRRGRPHLEIQPRISQQIKELRIDKCELQGWVETRAESRLSSGYKFLSSNSHLKGGPWGHPALCQDLLYSLGRLPGLPVSFTAHASNGSEGLLGTCCCRLS